MPQPFYHQTIRNTIVAFGSMFADFSIVRQKGTKTQTVAIPIAYAQKEKWLQEIEQNPDANKAVQTTLPRMAFEIIGYRYASERKLARMNRIECEIDGVGRRYVLTPVPYDVMINLYIAARTQEDSLQILEQILPMFAPEYTLAVNAVPALNIVQDVPFTLTDVSVSDNFDGSFADARLVVHTLSFVAGVNLYAGLREAKVIKQSEANVDTNPTTDFDLTYIAAQPTPTAPINEQWLVNF